MKRYGHSRTGTGVRGSVEYRRASDLYVKNKSCPKALLVAVNVLAVLLSLLLFLGVAYVFTPLGDLLAFGREKQEITLQFEFIDTDGSLALQSAVGTALFDATRGTVIGEIVAIDTAPLKKEAYVTEGGATLLPDTAATETVVYSVQVVTVTVRATAEYRRAEGYFTAWGEKLYVGGRYAVSFGSSIVAGDCITIVPTQEVSE